MIVTLIEVDKKWKNYNNLFIFNVYTERNVKTNCINEISKVNEKIIINLKDSMCI